MSAPRTPGRAVVIGGGIAGLATAALLAADGWSVSLFEARDERRRTRGHAGSSDGFRFDTGPSWYLMPEVFEHFFRLLGTTAERRARPGPARPGLPRLLRSGDGLPPARRAVRAGCRGRPVRGASSRARAPGCGPTSTPPRTRTTSPSPASCTTRTRRRPGLRDPALLRRVPQLAPLLTRTLAAHVERRFTDPRLRQILGVPRRVPRRLARTTCRASTT